MGEGIRILVVDDTDHVRRMLRTMLQLDGFDVVAEASGGDEAVRLLDGITVDVVVVDYKMPDVDGLETATRILERRPEQVVIMYTAFVDPDLQDRARRAGVAAVLGKVEGLESLEQEIVRLCGTLF